MLIAPASLQNFKSIANCLLFHYFPLVKLVQKCPLLQMRKNWMLQILSDFRVYMYICLALWSEHLPNYLPPPLHSTFQTLLPNPLGDPLPYWTCISSKSVDQPGRIISTNKHIKPCTRPFFNGLKNDKSFLYTSTMVVTHTYRLCFIGKTGSCKQCTYTCNIWIMDTQLCPILHGLVYYHRSMRFLDVSSVC